MSRFGADSVRLLAPRGVAEPREALDESGVKLERAAEVLGATLVRLQLALQPDDFVLMNTAAVSRNYLDVVLDSLRDRGLSHAYWYIHENVDHLPVVAPFLLQPSARDHDRTS